MHRYRAPSIAPGTFFVAQSLADFIINMSESNLRQAQPMKTPVCRDSRASISDAINFAMLLFEENLYHSLRRVIDIRRLADQQRRIRHQRGD